MKDGKSLKGEIGQKGFIHSNIRLTAAMMAATLKLITIEVNFSKSYNVHKSSSPFIQMGVKRERNIGQWMDPNQI